MHYWSVCNNELNYRKNHQANTISSVEANLVLVKMQMIDNYFEKQFNHSSGYGRLTTDEMFPRMATDGAKICPGKTPSSDFPLVNVR